MITANLIFGATVSRANVETLARKAPSCLIDAEGDPDESAGPGQCGRENRPGNVHLDRAIVEIQARNKCKSVHVGASPPAGEADLKSPTNRVAGGPDGRIPLRPLISAVSGAFAGR